MGPRRTELVGHDPHDAGSFHLDFYHLIFISVIWRIGLAPHGNFGELEALINGGLLLSLYCPNRPPYASLSPWLMGHLCSSPLRPCATLAPSWTRMPSWLAGALPHGCTANSAPPMSHTDFALFSSIFYF